MTQDEFEVEKAKFGDIGIFIMVSDELADEVQLGRNDFILDCQRFPHFSGPILAIRKIMSENDQNPLAAANKKKVKKIRKEKEVKH